MSLASQWCSSHFSDCFHFLLAWRSLFRGCRIILRFSSNLAILGVNVVPEGWLESSLNNCCHFAWNGMNAFSVYPMECILLLSESKATFF